MMLLECFIFGMIASLITGARCKVTEVFAEAGSQAVLPCKSSSTSLASPFIIWSKANKGTIWRKQKSGLQYWGSSWSQKGIQRVQCPNSLFERGDYSLHINNVREEDGGVYSCSVENGVQVVENVVMLRIMIVSFSLSVPILGKDVSVTCNVTPWPHGASVHWMLNNSPFVPQTGISSNRDTSKIVVRVKATARLTGNWTCVVGYKGSEGRASATLSVKGIIKPPNDNTKVYASVGSAAALPCVFSNDLVPSLPVWEKLQPGSLFKPAPGRLPSSFSPSSQSSQLAWDKSASLKAVEFKDEGRYRCSGTVQGQRLSRNIQLIVAKIDSSVPSKKKGSVTLTCQLSDASEVTDYEWVHVTYDLNGTQSVGFIQKGKTLSISQGSEENQGEWACRFSGKEGILGNVTYHVQLMSGLNGQKSKGFSHNTAAVVGLSFLLFVLLLILAQMYKNHQRRKRIFQYPALETIVHTISNEREERERNRAKK
ncbi:hemicentin-2-like isoform X2 [Xiphias gladius]|nr:hemicentin-2-like isoform X2 [Xiphias gladius]XP_039973496.1 hemicentin-2-like isoform X2 [Xiphias gladius]XP_039973497.1 hemicentin-2-like isoform X2 [Xiphias gladius]XP_039973498.1 hemicentin-2-like isoform X2 [Xiphias gladius]XP_039973499.1 hemicentin-2-like isoform X2 [Xiphias gladius]